MSRRILSVIMSVVLLVGLMPLPAFAGDSDDESYAAGLLKANGLTLAPAGNEKPEPEKVTCFNDGDAPTLQVEYEDADGKTWVELYLVSEAQEGDPKGKLGVIEVDGKPYHVRGIMTVDPSNPARFYKDPETGRYVAKET